MATTPTATSPNSVNETQLLPTAVGNSLEEGSISRSSSYNRRSHSEPRVARRTVSSPRANPYPNPSTTSNTSARARRRADARRWGWLPTTLATWRIEEGIQLPNDGGELSAMDLSPYTQEPTHYTVPVLAARLHRHEDRLHAMEIEQHETHSNWMHLAQGRVAQIYQDQEDITETMGTVHNQVIGNRNEISVLQSRLEQCETRLRETEDHSRSLEQRLAMAEETLRMVGRLTETMERVVTLLPPPNPRQD